MTTNGLSELEELLIPILAFENDIKKIGEHIGTVMAKLLHERNQAFALAKGFAEALELIKNGGVPQGVPANVAERMLAMCEVAEKALSASPTSLLERFKAEQEVLDLCRKFLHAMDRDSASCIGDEIFEALEALESLK